MEVKTKWLSKRGDSKSTKPEQRALALHITNRAWKNINGHLDRRRLLQEAIAKQIAHKLAVTEETKNMTENWDNSVTNIQKRKEQARIENTKNVAHERMQRFLEMRKEQVAVREQIVQDAQKILYTTGEDSRKLNSALILSEVLHERENQIKHKAKIDEAKRQDEEMYAQKVKEAAEQEKVEKLEKAKQVYQKNLEMRNLYVKEMQEKKEQAANLKRKNIENERECIIPAKLEIQKMEYFQQLKKKEQNEQIKNELHKFVQDQKIAKMQENLLDQEHQTINDIYNRVKHQIKCKRQKVEDERIRALQRRQEAISQKLEAETSAKFEEEQLRLQKNENELKRKEDFRLAAESKYKDDLINQRLEQHQEFLKGEEDQKFEANEFKKWDMLNRFKTCHTINHQEAVSKRKKWEDTLKYRDELCKQMEEKLEKHRKAKEIERLEHENAKIKLTETDGKFFDYSREVFKCASDKGWETTPIKRVVEEYMKDNNLPKITITECEKL